MISKESFELYEKLVFEDNYHNLFDLSIIYQVNNYLELIQEVTSTEDFKRLCNKVKEKYLKYDYELNDELIEEVVREMGLYNE